MNYSRIVIRDESDLPKDVGWYFVSENEGGMSVQEYVDVSEYRINWLANIEWYLVEQSSEIVQIKQCNAAQALAMFIWKSPQFNKVQMDNSNIIKVDQQALLEYLMKFQKFIWDSQDKL